MPRFLILLLIPLFLFASTDTDRALKMMKVEQRVALVIGNNLYDHKRLLPLQNPVNDARAMKAKLEQLGFKVIYGENLRVRDMDKKLDQFTGKLKQGGVGLFFFAGHGVEYQGINYLMGKDSKVDDKNDVKYESLPLSKALDAMQTAGNRLNIVMLDACRNDPFSRTSGGGLAKSTARGTFIAYATSPGDVASDGSGKNGVFTENILKYIDKPGIPIELLFKNIKQGVVSQTKERQRPWTNSDIIGDFFFVLPDGSKPTTTVTTTPTVQPKEAGPVEQELWNEVVKDGSKEYYELYLKEYPNGAFTALAYDKLAQFKAAEEEAKRQEAIAKAEQEKKDWEAIKDSKYGFYFDVFLKKYPDGKYAALAKLKAKKYSGHTNIVHNGTEYRVVQSPYTSRIWLDRNLGAKRVCQSYNDEQCYGDYYQWGRAADGHEKSGSSSFIKAPDFPYDWKPNDSSGSQRQAFWNRTDGLGICPRGFRVPTIDELEAETLSQGVKTHKDAFNNFLKLPSAGFQGCVVGDMYNQVSHGFVWSSSPGGTGAQFLQFYSDDAEAKYGVRANGLSVRCLKE
jgi:uncharacterized protein (TIGR02145 family)